ncbi:MAG: hypothetical protein U5K69_08065 [Balneolaceae bacterium]|nr:hypothetical protein [Balneolaceae bacterium]
MQIQWFTFVAQIVNFLILVLLLRRFLYKPVIKAMDRREQQIAGRLEEARLNMLDAKEKEAVYEQKLREFDRHKEQRLQQAREEVDQLRKEMMAEVRAEILLKQQQWSEALYDEKEAFLRELQVQAGREIVDISNQILADLSNRSLEEQVTEIFIQHLAELSSEESNRLLTSALDYGFGAVEVKSSFGLADHQKKRITALLREKIAPKLECRFEVVPALGFGVEVRAGGWRTGWNLNSYIGRLRQEMEQVFVQNMPGKNSNIQKNGLLQEV